MSRARIVHTWKKEQPMEYAKITLLIPLTDDEHMRPDKWDWAQLTDHNSEIHVVDSEFLAEFDAFLEYPTVVETARVE